MKIAFIGFGEAAGAFQKSLAETHPAVRFTTYDILFDSEGRDGPTAERARAAGATPAESHVAAVEDADWVISAVTAASSLEAARSTAPGLSQGQVFLDINSVSPDRKRETAKLFGPGVGYVDMAVMAPVHPRGHRTPTLVAGAPDELRQVLDRLGFVFEAVGDEIGAATAIKMARSMFVKGLEAITVEALLAASASGCFDYVFKSLQETYPSFDLPRLADYHLERTLKHGVRRAAEMRESAATVSALGLEGSLGSAIADVQEAMGTLPRDELPGEGDLAERLERIARLRREA